MDEGSLNRLQALTVCVERPSDMDSPILDVTGDLKFSKMSYIRNFVASYGSAVLCGVLDVETMEAWTHLHHAVVHYLQPKEGMDRDEDTFNIKSQEAWRSFNSFCAATVRLFGDNMAIPSWHQVRVLRFYAYLVVK